MHGLQLHACRVQNSGRASSGAQAELFSTLETVAKHSCLSAKARCRDEARPEKLADAAWQVL